ncbi:MAG: circularly permuted type 2 ATP-grasp protein, partial [Gammaproteobacteria bacterium]|nr:circularly permuted type 2 ATP-grasp protein [Gammaproteobacteria bacterium]
MAITWKNYSSGDSFDELITPGGRARTGAGKIVQYLRGLSDGDLRERREAAELAMHVMGITFTVYSEEGGIDRAWPFDIIPRIISAREWRRTDEGLQQRVQALNMFIADLYDEQRIIKDGIFPQEVLEQSVNFREQCIGIKPALGVWAHICGSDL